MKAFNPSTYTINSFSPGQSVLAILSLQESLEQLRQVSLAKAFCFLSLPSDSLTLVTTPLTTVDPLLLRTVSRALLNSHHFSGFYPHTELLGLHCCCCCVYRRSPYKKSCKDKTNSGVKMAVPGPGNSYPGVQTITGAQGSPETELWLVCFYRLTTGTLR